MSWALVLVAALLAHGRMASARPQGSPQTAEVSPPPRRAQAQRSQPPFFVHVNAGVIVLNALGPTATQPATTITIRERQSILQLAGFGYFFHPKWHVSLSLQFSELVGNRPANVHPLQLAALIPWVGWHPVGPLFIGFGPFLAARIYGRTQFDTGLWTTIGVNFPLGHGFGLGASVQVPVVFVNRVAVTVAPAVLATYRF